LSPAAQEGVLAGHVRTADEQEISRRVDGRGRCRRGTWIDQRLIFDTIDFIRELRKIHWLAFVISERGGGSIWAERRTSPAPVDVFRVPFRRRRSGNPTSARIEQRVNQAALAALLLVA
jgi:hypothetical protein